MRAETTRPVDRRVRVAQAFDSAIDAIGLREYRLSRSDFADTRQYFPISFGYGSFTESIDNLRFCGLL